MDPPPRVPEQIEVSTMSRQQGVSVSRHSWSVDQVWTCGLLQIIDNGFASASALFMCVCTVCSHNNSIIMGVCLRGSLMCSKAKVLISTGYYSLLNHRLANGRVRSSAPGGNSARWGGRDKRQPTCPWFIGCWAKLWTVEVSVICGY